MKLSWITDIHLNFTDAARRHQFYQDLVDSSCDAVLISGDIAEAPSVEDMLQELAQYIKKPLYFVLGNHDYYRGQVQEVRHKMAKLTKANEYLFWLPASGPLQLNDQTFLVGQDGWADGRLGNYYDTKVAVNDSRLIKDLFQENVLGRQQLLEKMQELADNDAGQLGLQLIDVTAKKPQRVIVLTHVPPFKEACLHRDKLNTEAWLPFYTSKATGDVLLNICTAHPDIDFSVFCGHTHRKVIYQPLQNLRVESGQAEYYEPEIQSIIFI